MINFDGLGLLGSDLVAAHCVWLDDAEIAMLALHQVGRVHNPSSNVMLAMDTIFDLSVGTSGLGVSGICSTPRSESAVGDMQLSEPQVG